MENKHELILQIRFTRPMVFAFIASILGSILGICMLIDGSWIGLFLILGLGSSVFYFLTQLPPIGPCLKLTQHGFRIRSAFRTHTYQWSEVERFGIARFSGRKFVAFNLVSGLEIAPQIQGLLRGIGGFDIALPNTYGMEIEDLVGTLNAWKARSMKG